MILQLNHFCQDYQDSLHGLYYIEKCNVLNLSCLSYCPQTTLIYVLHSPCVIYSSCDSFQVCLQASNTCGTDTLPLAFAPPSSAFGLSQDSICPGDTLNTQSAATGSQWQWLLNGVPYSQA